MNIRYNNFKISSCRDVSPEINDEQIKEVRSRLSINMIHCPKFLRALPFWIRICITALVSGLISGDGGEFGDFGNAVTDVSVFMVTINCSFNASCR